MTVSSLKINTSIINNDNLGKRIFYGLSVTLALLFLSYLYFLGTITFNIVERKALESEAKDLASDVSGLELQYLALSNTIDMQFAGELGFSQVKTEHFASRTGVSTSVALRDHGVQ